jgi:histidinol-phosphatase (PHP family)
MAEEDLTAYAAEIRGLATAWAPGGHEAKLRRPMEVLVGLEVDWFPGEREPGDHAFDSIAPDFLIGSVHFAEAAAGQPFTVDCSQERFDAALAEAKTQGGDIHSLYRDFYKRQADMIDSGGFDILGHFDLIKKNNVGARLFDEGSRDYLDAAFEAASHLSPRGPVVEINLGGMARGKTKEPYPSLAILRELRRLDIPITFTADAHQPAHLGVYLENAREYARKAGYSTIRVLTKGNWLEVAINET